MSKLFLVTSGGTGMRCLQSFVQLCAMGMFPGKVIDVLLLETDNENKDKLNTENLVKWYNQIRGDSAGQGIQKDGQLVGPYFSAKINLHTFVPDYTTEATRNFVVLSQVERGNDEINHMLANIFYEEGVQEFNLAHGFRAQTHLGSYLMYHAIIDEVRKSMADDNYDSALFSFIKSVQEASSVGARVFALGSTFGGTGASSIPIITRGITDSCKILTGDKIQMSNIHYGAVVLSNYFSFNPPSDAHVKKDKVIARSEFFEHNSASALMFYVNDPTILSTYKRLYILGWGAFKDYNTDKYKELINNLKGNDKTATGGKHQTNPAHMLELFGAYAAKHFFDDQTTKQKDLEKIKSTEFRYKTLEVSGSEVKVPQVSFEDLYSVPGDVSGSVEKKSSGKAKRAVHEVIRDNMVGFVTLAAILDGYHSKSVGSFLSNLKRYNINYEFNDTQTEALDNYMAYFFNMDSEEGREQASIPGWVKQLYLTFHGEEGDPGEKFLGLSGSVFGKGDGRQWFNNFSDFIGQEQMAMDSFMAKLMALNETGKSASDLKVFLEHIRQATSHFPIVNGLKKNPVSDKD